MVDRETTTTGPQTGQSERGQSARSATRVMTVVFVALLIDLIAFTSILPIFPRIIRHYILQEQHQHSARDQATLLGLLLSVSSTISPAADLESTTVLVGGLLGALFSLLQFLSSFSIGSASDTHGRRPVLLLCMVGTSLSYLLWFVADDFSLFVASRALGGMSKGIVQISNSVITDITTPQTRTRGMALIGIAFSLGFTVGPALGAHLASLSLGSLPAFPAWLLPPASHSFPVPALFSLALSVLALLVLALLLPETTKHRSARGHPATQQPAEREDVVLGSDERRLTLNRMHLIHFLFLMFFSGIEFTLPFLTVDRFGYSNYKNGRMFAFVGILSIAIQGGYLRRSGARVGAQVVALQGMVSLVAGALVLASASDEITLFGGVALYTAASALVVSCLTSLTSVYALKDERGTELGKFRSYGQLGRALGPFLVCVCYWLLGSSAAYLIAGVLTLLPLSLMYRLSAGIQRHLLLTQEQPEKSD